MVREIPVGLEREAAEGFVAAAAETFAGVPGNQPNGAELIGVQHLIPAARAFMDQPDAGVWAG